MSVACSNPESKQNNTTTDTTEVSEIPEVVDEKIESEPLETAENSNIVEESEEYKGLPNPVFVRFKEYYGGELYSYNFDLAEEYYYSVEIDSKFKELGFIDCARDGYDLIKTHEDIANEIAKEPFDTTNVGQ